MSLLSFDPRYRRIWMFPRNIRNIVPWKLHQALIVLMKCSDLNVKSGDDQKYIYRMLEEAGIKGKSNTRDKNPGGMRTYLAQLSMLGMLYEDRDKQYRYTIAGQNLADGNNPLRVLQFQLLRHQYPSAYGLGRNVMIDPRMKVKPFMFLIRLMRDERIGGYLSCEDMMIPVVYGHNDSCYEICVQKILTARQGSIESAIDDFELDLYTPRSGMGSSLSNVKDIANTGKNYLSAAGLIIDSGKIAGKSVYSFNENYVDIYEALLRESDFLECRSDDEKESFQRAYGRYDKKKDTRSESETHTEKESPEVAFVQFRYVIYANDNLFVAEEEPFYNEMKEMGISSGVVSKAIEPYKMKRRSIDENNFLEAANSGGEKSEEFEKGLTNLFISLGFDKSKWIGRKKSYSNWRGNFPDVFLKRSGTADAGFIDAKASSGYSLGHSDMLKMKDTYIGCMSEIDNESNLCYFVYVAGGFKGNVGNSVEQLASATGIPVTAMDARTVLRLRDKEWSAEEIEKKVLFHGGLLTEEELVFME